MKVSAWHVEHRDSAQIYTQRLAFDWSIDDETTVTPLVTLAEAEAAVKQAREDALEEATADLAEALMHDCENGVKFLNEKAIEDFKKNFPCLNLAIESLKGKT